MIIKCKPVYNFQSVEFEFEINGVNDLPEMFALYKLIVSGLKDIAPEQPAQPKAVTIPKEPMATEKQKNLLIKLGLDEKEVNKMTTKQAFMKIKELTE